MFCGNCGEKIVDRCSICELDTITKKSLIGRIDIPQIPISFDNSQDIYPVVMYKSGHVIHHINLPTDTPFGNLMLIFIQQLENVDHLNGRIRKAFESYALGKYYPFTTKITEHRRQGEEVIYWMKRVADRLVSLHWLVYSFTKNGSYPNQIQVDSIGPLKNNDAFKKEYSNEALEFLDFLNDVANANKHSLVNDESPSMRVGRDEPLVIALHIKDNKLNAYQKYKHDSLFNVVVKFTFFYKEMREILTRYQTN